MNVKSIQQTSLATRQDDETHKKNVNVLFAGLAQEFSKRELYDEGNVYDEYENMSHAMKGIYTYLYDQGNSSLKSQDAKIFASYLMSHVKALTKVIEKTKK